MARPRNVSENMEFRIPLPEVLKLPLVVFAKVNGFSTPNEAAVYLIREGLTREFGKIGSAEYFASSTQALNNFNGGLSGLARQLETQESEVEGDD